MKISNDFKMKATANATAAVRRAFAYAMQESQTELVQSVEDQDQIPALRTEMSELAPAIAKAVITAGLYTPNSKEVTASVKPQEADLVRIAMAAYRNGHHAEGMKLFAFASTHTSGEAVDIELEIDMDDSLCPACGAPTFEGAVICSQCQTSLTPKPGIQPENNPVVPDTLVVKPLDPATAALIKKLSAGGNHDLALELLACSCDVATEEEEEVVQE